MTDPITSDNIHLSEAIQARPALKKSGDGCTEGSIAACVDPKISEFIIAATASATRRAYQSDIARYQAWGGRIPTEPEQVARYLADHAATLSMATLARRLAGIRAAHVERGFPDPTKSEIVRVTFRGVRRKFGQPQRRVVALSTGDLLAIVRSLGRSVRDVRDAAILLVGFAGAFRRSELVAIDRQNLEIGESGVSIRIPRSKTDQEAHGRTLSIPRVPGALCPVAALEEWLIKAVVIGGPVFRPVTKAGKALPIRISPEAIARILKNRVETIGCDSRGYSGHSLRAGFATAASRSGVPLWRIRAQTGHLSDSMLERYIRERESSSICAFKSISASAG